MRLLSGPDQAARLGLTASVFGTRTVSQGSKRLSNGRVQRALRLRLRSDAKRCSARRPRKAHKLAGVRGRGQAGEIALHTGISDFRRSDNGVVKYKERKLRKDGTLDVPVMAHEMTQNLVDMIMDRDERHYAPPLDLMILSLGDECLQRNGIGERRDN